VSARQNLVAQEADLDSRECEPSPASSHGHPKGNGRVVAEGRHDRMSAIEASETPEPLGHELVGHGPAHVIVLNDWLCDTSTWDGARRYLDETRFTFAFADLRGYGRSRSRAGAFTVEEAAHDTLVLADVVGWDRFAVVGHSMSSLVALHLAQHYADRIERWYGVEHSGAAEMHLRTPRSLAFSATISSPILIGSTVVCSSDAPSPSACL
jgi:pimeloyl-ACP methyl ester carboxylesterase